jgi:hypothetical protein
MRPILARHRRGLRLGQRLSFWNVDHQRLRIVHHRAGRHLDDGQRSGACFPHARLFVMTGLCGGFTTFSAFSLQSVELMRSGSWLPAIAYMAASLVLCVGAAQLGYWLGLLLASASTLES